MSIEPYFIYSHSKRIFIIVVQNYKLLAIVRHLLTMKVQLALERESNVAEIKSQRRSSVPTRKVRGVALNDLSLINLKYDCQFHRERTIKYQSIQLTPNVFTV